MLGVDVTTMCEHSILQIRQSIELAKQQEAKTHELQSYLQKSLPRLHKAIDLPKENPSQVLLNFVGRYIQQVPDVLEALTKMLQNSGTFSSCEVFIHIAEDFFLKPPEIIQSHTGLQALINEAYLAHRLIEELNDRLMMVSGVQLIPLDMTLPNIIVHDLLGEDFANQLDLAVHYAIEALFQQELIDTETLAEWAKSQDLKQWQKILANSPSFEHNEDIQLNLHTSSSSDSVH